MKKENRGGTRKAGPGKKIGRTPVPSYLKKVRVGDARITQYKKDALKTLPVSLGTAIEAALDKEYPELFKSFLGDSEDSTLKHRRNTMYKTAWSDSNGFWFLMTHRDGSVIMVEDSQHDLALAQGSSDIEEEYVELCDKDVKRLGLED